MKLKYVSIMVACTGLVFLAGCGGGPTGNADPATKNALAESQACITCHEGTHAGSQPLPIVTEWLASTHNTHNGASCVDCHGSGYKHTTSAASCSGCHTLGGQAVNPSDNPDRDRRCEKCHDRTNGTFPDGPGIRQAHFANTNYPVTFGGYTASYVSTNYIGNCRKCHNPHDPTTNMAYNRAWADSGHGDLTANSRVSRDFKLFGTDQPASLAYTNSSPSATTDPAAIAKGTPVCVRCHTTTGYINFVESGFVSLKPFGSNTDKTKEVTACNACHPSFDFKVRTVPAVTIFYNFSGQTASSTGNPSGHAKIQNIPEIFPDLKASNICIPCHAGRGIGSTIKGLQALGVNFGNLNSPSSHDFSGAAILTAKSGYEFDGKQYANSAGADTGHDTTGLSSGKGPCITCHMNKSVKSDSHTFKPVIHDTAQFDLFTTNRTWTQVYSVSNTSLASQKIASISSLSCNTSNCHAGLVASTLNSDKEGYISALAVLNKWIRLVRNVPVKPQSPFNSSTNKARSTTKWDYLGSATGPDLMGASFNLSTLNNEPGAYVHRPVYAKQLVYDSIFFLCTTATDPALGINQYPTTQQFNVADAIHYLTTTTATTLETVNGVSNTAARATISSHQADAAIQWLYGKTWADLSASDKLKRPGDN